MTCDNCGKPAATDHHWSREYDLKHGDGNGCECAQCKAVCWGHCQPIPTAALHARIRELESDFALCAKHKDEIEKERDALHARIAELTKERDEAKHIVGKNWLQHCREITDQRDVALNVADAQRERTDAAHWQAFASQWEAIGRLKNMEREHDLRCMERDEYKANAEAAEDVTTYQRDRAKTAERRLEDTERRLTDAIARAATAELRAKVARECSETVERQRDDAEQKLAEAESNKRELNWRLATAERERDALVGVVDMQHRALVAIDEDPAILGDGTVGILCCALAAYDSLDDAARRATTDIQLGPCSVCGSTAPCDMEAALCHCGQSSAVQSGYCVTCAVSPAPKVPDGK